LPGAGTGGQPVPNESRSDADRARRERSARAQSSFDNSPPRLDRVIGKARVATLARKSAEKRPRFRRDRSGVFVTRPGNASGAAVGVIARCLRLSRASALPETLRARLSVAMICDQIECRTAPARRFRREKLLAALLIMCNAAENFLPADLNLANDARLARQKSKSCRSVRRATKGFAAGLVPTVESPVATGRAPCFASLTFEGG